MNIIYQSVAFQEKDIVSVYARLYSNNEVKFVDVNIKGQTIREWWTQLENVEHKDKLVMGETVSYSGMAMQEREAISPPKKLRRRNW